MNRVATAASYALVLVLAIELAVWGAFLVGLRVFGYGLPVAALVAGVGNVSLGIAGARVLRSRLGAVLPGLIWFVIALTLGTKKTEGDVIVQGGFRGVAFLVVGSVAAAAVVGVTSALSRSAALGATPGAPAGR
ncbi:MAG: hypothetical protein JWM02_626 [Frankiales bacterium]|nr:hypothetical protein [Frankiales bacterium]